MKGSRILGIVKELRNENIDVIQYTSNVRLFIQRALAISKVVSIDINEDRKRASVVLNPDQISLAIGKNGVNIRLAGKLTGYEIDVYRDSEEEEYDIELDEFSDEIDQWVIDQFKAIGCDTARSVLSLNLDELVRRTDLEEETVRDVLRVIEEEFDSDEEEEGNNKEN